MSRRSFKRILSRARGRTHLVALASVAICAGGLVLLRAPTHANFDTSLVPQPSGPTVAGVTLTAGLDPVSFVGPGLSGTVDLSQRAVEARPGEQTLFAEVNLRAAEVDPSGERVPLAVAVVLDTSGSMQGDKIEHARSAIRQLLNQMRPADRVALVTYDTTAAVRWSLAEVSALRGWAERDIAGIAAGGGTSIPDGLRAGFSQLASAPSHFAKRVVLLSDGVDGSGISLPGVSQMVQHLSANGTAASALGLGLDYSEAFLATVAEAGAGNYAFAASGAEVAPFLRAELEEVQGLALDQLFAELTLPAGWRVARGLGSVVNRRGNAARVSIGQLEGGASRAVVIELTGPARDVGNVQEFGVRLGYRLLSDTETHSISPPSIALRTVASAGEALAARVNGVYTRTQAVAIDEDQREAVAAWRLGDSERAQRISEGNRARLEQLAAETPEEYRDAIEASAEANAADFANFQTAQPTSAAGRAYGLRSNAARSQRRR